eukprot:TRINITY_DN37872_c0_g1_i1.p1 TRINITY_DN37872_c0_g1~~TRINITY_DN37872_c0_g1_i1.p1  ORF type:complete len:526 (+),score=126.92 TRINITY_DN37872_c0_g1_i1:130-1707(+)
MSLVNGISAVMRDISKVFSGGRRASTQEAFLVGACALVVTLLDVYQLIFMCLGGLFYALLLKSQQRLHIQNPKGKHDAATPRNGFASASSGRYSGSTPQRRAPRAPGPHFNAPGGGSQSARGSAGARGAAANLDQDKRDSLRQKDRGEASPLAASCCPVKRYEFVATNWVGEVAELLTQISPTQEHVASVGQLAAKVERSVRATFPTAHVVGYALGQLSRRQAFGVAVPDVELVVIIDSDWLRDWHRGPRDDCMAHRKSALRLISERLVSQNSGFRFRRSAYRCAEPKVTLLANRGADTARSTDPEDAIAMDLYVNGVLPGYGVALLSECTRFEPCSRDVFWLVRHWAKYRGICHGSQGHLTPYLWSLLVIFFLQTRDGENAAGASRVPPLADFNVPEDLKTDSRASAPMAPGKQCAERAAELFKAFIRFYSAEFDWAAEVVSIREGRRSSAAAAALKPVSGLHIEDPRDAHVDLGSCMHGDSSTRLRQELSRADEIMSRDGSLAELLQIWAPREEEQPAREPAA